MYSSHNSTFFLDVDTIASSLPRADGNASVDNMIMHVRIRITRDNVSTSQLTVCIDQMFPVMYSKYFSIIHSIQKLQHPPLVCNLLNEINFSVSLPPAMMSRKQTFTQITIIIKKENQCFLRILQCTS